MSLSAADIRESLKTIENEGKWVLLGKRRFTYDILFLEGTYNWRVFDNENDKPRYVIDDGNRIVFISGTPMVPATYFDFCIGEVNDSERERFGDYALIINVQKKYADTPSFKPFYSDIRVGTIAGFGNAINTFDGTIENISEGMFAIRNTNMNIGQISQWLLRLGFSYHPDLMKYLQCCIEEDEAS